MALRQGQRGSADFVVSLSQVWSSRNCCVKQYSSGQEVNYFNHHDCWSPRKSWSSDKQVGQREGGVRNRTSQTQDFRTKCAEGDRQKSRGVHACATMRHSAQGSCRCIGLTVAFREIQFNQDWNNQLVPSTRTIATPQPMANPFKSALYALRNPTP